MLEDSIEGFIARFRSSAADVRLSGHVEGNPLLECVVAGTALHVFERTGPYLSRSGPARVILHVECDAVERVGEPSSSPAKLEVVGVSALVAEGVVLMRDDPFLIVDVGVPLVIGVTTPIPELAVGEVVRFATRPPIHGFVLPNAAARIPASSDEQV